jgi:hypothetical protein
MAVFIRASTTGTLSFLPLIVTVMGSSMYFWMLFLDACRDNPFAAKIRSAASTRSVNVQTGLAEMKSGEGTRIAFATGPGQTALDGQEGINSPFTRALMANIAKPGVEIQLAMTQVRAQVSEETNKGQLPWGHTNLIGSVYLHPVAIPAGTPVEAANTLAPTASTASEVELEFWRSIKDSNKPEELNAYRTSYPDVSSSRWRWHVSPRYRMVRALRPETCQQASIPRPSPTKRPRPPKTRLASTRASAARCSAVSLASASTPRSTESSMRPRAP